MTTCEAYSGCFESMKYANFDIKVQTSRLEKIKRNVEPRAEVEVEAGRAALSARFRCINQSTRLLTASFKFSRKKKASFETIQL